MTRYLVSNKFGVSPPKSKVLINSVTRNGVHLVGSVLEIIGMNYGNHGLINRKRVQLNFRTSQYISNYFVRWTNKKAPISVGSPRMVRIKLIERLCAKINKSEFLAIDSAFLQGAVSEINVIFLPLIPVVAFFTVIFLPL